MENSRKNADLNLEIEKKKIGVRFRQLRKEMGYTSHETFAYDNNLDRAQYGKIEAGSANLTLKVFIKHLNVMRVSFSEFFNEDYDKIDLNGNTNQFN